MRSLALNILMWLAKYCLNRAGDLSPQERDDLERITTQLYIMRHE